MSEKIGKNGKPFNPSLGSAFTNDKFGEGAILLQITEENFDVIMKNLRPGCAFLFKFNKVTTAGNKHYYGEMLPPMQKDYRAGKGTTKAPVSEID